MAKIHKENTEYKLCIQAIIKVFNDILIKKKSEHYLYDIDHERLCEGYKRLCIEVVIKVFNDILTKKWYTYYIVRYTTGGKREKTKWIEYKLKRHFEAIEWLMTDRKNNIFLCYLGLENLTDRQMRNIISNRMDSEMKTYKIMKEC